MARAEGGVLRIRDGDRQQQFYLDADELRTGRVLYVPASNHVQFRLEVSAAGQRRVSESILAVSALPEEEPMASTRTQQSVYSVQVGAFQNRANADHMLRDMEARYGASYLEARRSDPLLWRVLVGRETTAKAAGRLARRIQSGSWLARRQAFVTAERSNIPRS